MLDAARQGVRHWPSVPARIAAFYAATYFITGLVTPYLPIWFEARRLTVVEIGTLAIIPQFTRIMFSPAVGFAADRYRSHRALIIALSALGLVAWGVLTQAHEFALASVAMTVIALSATANPLVETIAMAGVGSHGHDYGRMRLWGSAAFVVANLLGGWLAGRYGVDSLIYLMIFGAAATLAAAILLPQPESLKERSAAKRLSWKDARALLNNPVMQVFLIAAGCVQGAHGMFYAYGTLHWKAYGIAADWYGILWAIGLMTEIALFWWSRQAMRRIGAAELIVIAAALSVFRWTAMAFDPPLALLLPLQVLHGVTFGASHLGAMHVLAAIAPPDRSATAQAMYAFSATIGTMLATALAARCYAQAGGKTYLIMAMMALIGVAFAENLRRRKLA